MKNLKNIIIIICMVVTFIAWICYYSSYKDVKDQLTNAEQEIENLQSSLNDESTKLADANAEIDAVKGKLDNVQGELSNANAIIASRDGETYFIDCEVTEREIEMIAKTVWGEARGCNKLEQSAVVWCILNRVDAGWGSIAQVITAPSQFHGYNSSFPVTDEIKYLVEDVVARWKLEKTICGDVGRTLPGNYLYFVADGTGIGNIFKTAYTGECERWNWDCWNPYS